MVAVITLATTEVRDKTYNSEQYCTSDGPQTVVKKRSKVHCAAACNEQLHCREYNFDETTKDCSLYKHTHIPEFNALSLRGFILCPGGTLRNSSKLNGSPY